MKKQIKWMLLLIFLVLLFVVCVLLAIKTLNITPITSPEMNKCQANGLTYQQCLKVLRVWYK